MCRSSSAGGLSRRVLAFGDDSELRFIMRFLCLISYCKATRRKRSKNSSSLEA